MANINIEDIGAFVRESNRIEGIVRGSTLEEGRQEREEIEAHRHFLDLISPTVADLQDFVNVCQPGAVLRDKYGLDVYIGGVRAPKGSPRIRENLEALLHILNSGVDPAIYHGWYEHLHPFTDCNGRSGRVLWLWQMRDTYNPKLGFLHSYYYQTFRE